MLEDGTLFEKKGFDEEEKLEFITDEGQSIFTFLSSLDGEELKF